MYIYLALFLPILITLVFYFTNKKKFVWWELFVPFVATFVIIMLTKLLIDYSSVNFTEYWGSNVKYIYEEEPWNEWIQKTCSETTCTGSGKDEVCTTTYYDCSYQDDHSPEWYIETTIGERFYINERTFYQLLAQFKSQKVIIDQHSNYSSNSYANCNKGSKFYGRIVGDVSYVYKAEWKGDIESSKPLATEHHYINKIKASDLSVFNISIVNEKDVKKLKLYNYPELNDEFSYPTILGKNISLKTQENFKRLNGKFGPINKVRLWILVFNSNNPLVGQYQRNYWVNGNKNELVICIGKDSISNKINWVSGFSWTTNQEIITNIRDFIVSQDVLNDNTWFNIYKHVDENLGKFVKRSFKEFDYLTVEPHNWQIMLIIILSITVSIGVNLWNIINEYE
jgi:hypothetical protein